MVYWSEQSACATGIAGTIYPSKLHVLGKPEKKRGNSLVFYQSSKGFPVFLGGKGEIGQNFSKETKYFQFFF